MNTEITKTQEKKPETLEEVAMAGLNESPVGQQEDFSNFGKAMIGAFKSGLGDEFDNFLSSVDDKRREIKKIAIMVKEHLSKMINDGYCGQYKKETISGFDKILEGCEDILSGNYHLLNAIKSERLANRGHKI